MSFGSLPASKSDPLLSLMAAFQADHRPRKIDLGVGVYRDAQGRTPVFAAVKVAEQRLLDHQFSKSYLGSDGDLEFVRQLSRHVFAGSELPGLQTLGGTGALRLGGELLRNANPQRRLWLGVPTWPNHLPICNAAGLMTVPIDTYDNNTRRYRPDILLDALQGAAEDDVVLLHGCCHNPTGIDPDPDFWQRAADIIRGRGLVALIDCAYQGLGHGWEEDARGFSALLQQVPHALVAYSCNKNFGLYRERVGALFVGGTDRGPRRLACSYLSTLARTQYSMPPDHGAAVVRVILEDASMLKSWRSELTCMRSRIRHMRMALAARGRVGSIDLGDLRNGTGFFTQLPLSAYSVAQLQRQCAIYVAPSGRMNIAGLSEGDIDRFAAALDAVQRRTAA